jgi:hypothetical protein
VPIYPGNRGALYSNLRSHSGSLSAHNFENRTDLVVDEWGTNYFRTPLSNTLFVSYWYRMESINHSGVAKMGRITSSELAGGGGVYNGDGSMAIGGQPPCYSPFLGVSSDNPNNLVELGSTYFDWANCDEWVRMDMGRTLNDIGVSNGWILGDIVGYERQNWENIQNVFDPGNYDGKSLQLDTVLLGLMLANAPAGDTTTLFVDDIYIDNTRARIELGNNPIFNNSTHREMQLPTAWSSAGNNIQFTVNKGSFASGESVYLFVVNENGSVSPGYGPITIQ